MAGALALLVLVSGVLAAESGLVSASGPAAGLCQGQGWLGKYLPLIGIGWAGLLSFIAFAYMIGTSFSIPQLTEWAKAEIAQAVVGAVIVIALMGLMDTSCSLRVGEFAAWASAGDNTLLAPDDSMVGAALKGLGWSMTQTHVAIALLRYELGVINIRATYSMSVSDLSGLSGSGFTLAPLSGDWTMMGPLQMMLNLNTTFLITLLFQYFSLLLFASSSGLFLFLVPMGLILRCVPYLRGFGGSLAAIGIGLYLFYPLVLGLTALMLPPLYGGHDASDLAGTADVSEIVKAEQETTGTSITSYFYSMPRTDYNQDGVEISSALRATGVEGPDCGTARCFYTINLAPLFEMTAFNFVRAVLVPGIGLLVAASFVRDLATLLGGEVEAGKLIQMV